MEMEMKKRLCALLVKFSLHVRACSCRCTYTHLVARTYYTLSQVRAAHHHAGKVNLHSAAGKTRLPRSHLQQTETRASACTPSQ